MFLGSFRCLLAQQSPMVEDVKLSIKYIVLASLRFKTQNLYLNYPV